MEYCEFVEAVKLEVEKRLEKEEKLFINHVIKNNGCEMDGIVIMRDDDNISPNIYLNPFYNEYENGMSIQDVSNNIIEFYNNNKGQISINSQFFLNFENIKKTIVYKVINYESNKKLLEKVPHKKILDLAVVYYCLLEQFEDMSVISLIYNEHIKAWKITQDYIYKVARKNTPKLLKYSIKSMTDMVIDKFKDDFKLKFNQTELKELKQNDMFILTNESRLNGATCMLYENVLDKFANEIKSDLYILPSSIHEVIILPKKEWYKKSDLESMINEVNTDNLSVDEILSDRVYMFERKNGILTM